MGWHALNQNIRSSREAHTICLALDYVATGKSTAAIRPTVTRYAAPFPCPANPADWAMSEISMDWENPDAIPRIPMAIKNSI